MDPILDFVSVFAEGVLLAIAPVLASMVAAWLIAQVKTAWAKAREAAGEWVWVLDAIADKAVQAAEQATWPVWLRIKKRMRWIWRSNFWSNRDTTLILP